MFFEMETKGEKDLRKLKEALEELKNLKNENKTDKAKIEETLLNKIVKNNHSLGNNKDSFDYINSCLEILKQIEPSKSILKAFIRSFALESIQDALERYSKEPYSNTDTIQTKKSSFHASFLTATFNNIGEVYYNLRLYKNASKYFNMALTFGRNSLPENHPHIAGILNSIGVVHYKLNNHEEAIRMFKEALETVREMEKQDPNNPNIIATIENIGSAYYSLGKYNDAAHYIEMGFVRRFNSMSANHPDFKTSTKSMISVFSKLGRYEKVMNYMAGSFMIYYFSQSIFMKYIPLTIF